MKDLHEELHRSELEGLHQRLALVLAKQDLTEQYLKELQRFIRQHLEEDAPKRGKVVYMDRHFDSAQ